MLLTGKHGNAEVGYIDPTVLTGEENGRLILLAGRSWRVTGIEWSRKTVWLEPAKEGGKARWMGSARSLSGEICQAMRDVLADGAPNLVTLSQRARAALQFLRDDLSISPGTHFISSRPEDTALRTWTFAGTRKNRTLARHAAAGGNKVKFDALSVQAPVSLLACSAEEPIELSDDELSAFAEAVKFASCLPRTLLEATVVARSFDGVSPHH
jgi:ATP-dependent Lhr-like helicase